MVHQNLYHIFVYLEIEYLVFPSKRQIVLLRLSVAYSSQPKHSSRPPDDRIAKTDTQKHDMETKRHFSFYFPDKMKKQHRWFSGRMLACHAGGPGSIPGRCNRFDSSQNVYYFDYASCNCIVTTQIQMNVLQLFNRFEQRYIWFCSDSISDMNDILLIIQ